MERYSDWLKLVEEELCAHGLFDISDVPDVDFAAMYEDDLSPAEAAEQALNLQD